MAPRGKEEKRDFRLEVADRLIQQMEQGTARWQRPWKPGEILPPVNAVTGKPYRGVNYENLMIFSPDPSDPRWCTYKQAQEKGWQVRQGASGLPLEVWKEYEHKRTEEEIRRLEEQGATDIEPAERRLGVRYYTVFHASQIDGIPPLERPDLTHVLEGKPDERLPKLATVMGVNLQYGGGRAFYRSAEDRVQMPPVESFEQAVGHDTTLLHELSHATGHEDRLNRKLGNPFGSELYAIEELRAEMSAAMTAASLGLGFDPAAQDREEGRDALAGGKTLADGTTGNSAAYLASWLKALPEKDRKQTIMQVIKDAQGMSDYLMERTPEIMQETEVEKAAALSRGDYVQYTDEIGEKREALILGAVDNGLSDMYRTRPILRLHREDGADRLLLGGDDHFPAILIPENRWDRHIPNVLPPEAMDAVDPITEAYKRNITSELRNAREEEVLQAVEQALRNKAQEPDADLVAHLQTYTQIRRGERTDLPTVGDDWPGGLPTGLGGDRVENAQQFLRNAAEHDPQRAERWAAELRGNPHEYAEKVGLEADNIRGIATQMEQGAARMKNPQVGDLVRFEPGDPGSLKAMPYSGRVISRLDTTGGDFRYHLRTEVGPDQGMEATVYGRDGTFRLINPEQAYGFGRNSPERLAAEKAAEAQVNPKEQAIMAYNRFHQELPGNMDRFMERIDQRFDSLDPTNSDAFAKAMRDTMVEADKVFGIVTIGEDRGSFKPELELKKAGVEDTRKQELRDIWRDTSEAQTARYRASVDAARERVTERLKEQGKEILKELESVSTLQGLSPRQVVMASYWKHGVLVGDKSPTVNKMVKAIEEKDLKTLLPWIGHNSQNPGSEEAFSRITGVSLGKTQKERVSQLETWAGADRVAALNQEGAEKARQKAEEAPRKALRQAFDALSYSRIQVSTAAGSKVIDGQEYIERKVADGFTHIGAHKKGAVVERFLHNPQDGATSRINDQRFRDFCKAVVVLEPSGDLVKAMETAKIPLNLPEKPLEKAQEAQVAPADKNARKQGNPDPEKINAYEAKQQARRERYRALAEKMQARARAKLDQAHKMADAIPFGQPILVGHHSENRDRRYRGRIHKTFGQGFDLMDRAKYYERRSERMSNGISSDDPAAVQKLKKKLENLEKSQEMMKAANAVIRSLKTPEERKAGLEQIGFSDKQADKILTPNVMGAIGFASYSLSNNNANIRRIEERIKGLEKAEKLQDRITEYRWGAVRENKENNRIQFLFDGKPDEATRKLMKESGFRWAPSEEAWQRQWTGNAVYAAREAIRKSDARMPPEQAGQVLESAPAERKIAPVPPVRSDLPDSAGAADRLVKSLEVLEQHSLTLPRPDGTHKTVNARRYLDEGVARGFTEADTTANPLAWVNPETSTRLTVRDDALAATLRAAQAVDPQIGRAIRSVARQKTDLEWEM